MPLSLMLYLHKIMAGSYQKHFEKTNRVLTQSDIERLLSAKRMPTVNDLQILKSAVVDNSAVNGFSYHLSSPANGLFYHDSFKRVHIACNILFHFKDMDPDSKELALLILTKLLEDTNPGYVQILAWHALKQIDAEDVTTIPDLPSLLNNALKGTVPSLLGALIFLENFDQNQEERLLQIDAIEDTITYRTQRMLFTYWAHQNNFTSFKDIFLKQSCELETFIRKTLPKCHLTHNDFLEGCKYIGLLHPNQRKELWAQTPHEKVAQHIMSVCYQYVCVIGTYNSRK